MLPDEFSTNKKGFSFGIPYKFYENNYIPGYRNLSPNAAASIPPTGQYNISGEPG